MKTVWLIGLIVTIVIISGCETKITNDYLIGEWDSQSGNFVLTYSFFPNGSYKLSALPPSLPSEYGKYTLTDSTLVLIDDTGKTTTQPLTYIDENTIKINQREYRRSSHRN
jgi:hypothetical protein